MSTSIEIMSASPTECRLSMITSSASYVLPQATTRMLSASHVSTLFPLKHEDCHAPPETSCPHARAVRRLSQPAIQKLSGHQVLAYICSHQPCWLRMGTVYRLLH